MANSLTKSKAGTPPLVLATARQRRQRAQARDLLDEVAELRDALFNPKEAEQLVAGWNELMTEVYQRFPAKVAPTVAGLPAADVQRLLRIAVVNLLGEVNRTLVQRRDSFPAGEPEPRPDLDRLSPVELAALIENSRAELLELGWWERLGVPRVDDCIDACTEAQAVSKSLLLAVPGRVAQLVEFADVAEAERLLAVEIDGVCAALTPDWSRLTKGIQR